MLDVLLDYELLADLEPEVATLCPKENYLPSLDAYKESLQKVGFRYVRLEDCTDLTGDAACDYVVRMQEREYGRTQNAQILKDIEHIKLKYKARSPWCFVYAIK
jgi:hypothetical protein